LENEALEGVLSIRYPGAECGDYVHGVSGSRKPETPRSEWN
jgi:hypothetical protein